jgi:hypothetical protein
MSCCVNNNPNRYAGSGGGGSMLKKKYANKFNKVSSNRMFSLNGNTNHSYIGNQNNVNSHDPFSSVSNNKCWNEKKVNVSVKNSKGYLDAKLRFSPLNSANCYKHVNYALIDVSLNKHLRSENRDQSSHISNVKAQCSLNRTSYTDQITNKKCVFANCDNKVNRNISGNSRIEYLKRVNNVVKDKNYVNGFTPGYDIYYGDSTLYKKKAACNLYNPPDAKVIAC